MIGDETEICVKSVAIATSTYGVTVQRKDFQ